MKTQDEKTISTLKSFSAEEILQWGLNLITRNADGNKNQTESGLQTTNDVLKFLKTDEGKSILTEIINILSVQKEEQEKTLESSMQNQIIQVLFKFMSQLLADTDEKREQSINELIANQDKTLLDQEVQLTEKQQATTDETKEEIKEKEPENPEKKDQENTSSDTKSKEPTSETPSSTDQTNYSSFSTPSNTDKMDNISTKCTDDYPNNVNTKPTGEQIQPNAPTSTPTPPID